MVIMSTSHHTMLTTSLQLHTLEGFIVKSALFFYDLMAIIHIVTVTKQVDCVRDSCKSNDTL